jgi:nucleotide-binding universal stress UspA family protein
VKPILVTTDLSERSDRAIERAFLLAGPTGAEVVVLSVVDDGLAAGQGGADMVAAVRDRLASHIAALAVARDVTHRIEIGQGQAYREILRVAAAIDPAVIVMGLHRETMVLDLLRGTTVARVTRGGVWPVLIVRDHPDRAYVRAIVAVDFSDAARRALRAARMLAPHAERTLLHAYTIPFQGYIAVGGEPGAILSSPEGRAADAEARRDMAAFMAEMGPEPNPPVIAEGGFLAVLHRARAELKPDLVALGQHSRSGLFRALIGSAAEELLRDPPCDLLIA